MLIQAKNTGPTRLQPLLRITDKPKESGRSGTEKTQPKCLVACERAADTAATPSYLMPQSQVLIVISEILTAVIVRSKSLFLLSALICYILPQIVSVPYNGRK
jgi:hypothetical protein